MEIPVVDLSAAARSPLSRRAFAERLVELGHRVGFVVLVGHGAEPSLATVLDAAERFFALPIDEKEFIAKHRSRWFRGWEPVGSERTQNQPDLREQLDVWTPWPPRPNLQSGEAAYLRLLGPNQWPREAALPGFRAEVERWMAKMAHIADELLECFGLGLGLSERALPRLFEGESMSLLKIIRYPQTPQGGAGVNPHHDTGFLTLLAARDPGLEVRTDAGWVPVPVVPGGLVLNLGEMLQAMTSNHLIATQHRVIAGSERVSVGYFHGPPLDTPLMPLELPNGARVPSAGRASTAGYMASAAELAGGQMWSASPPSTYGAQLWNYFARSYPDLMRQHYGDEP